MKTAILIWLSLAASALAQFTVKKEEGRLEVSLKEQPVLSYYYKHAETTRPFFAHVKTPSGFQVTRNYPPVEGADRTDHPFMHPGLSLGFANLNGTNFWHNNDGVVEHAGFTEEPTDGDFVRFAVRNVYKTKDGAVICGEQASYVITANEDGYAIRMESRFTGENEFYFGVKEEMGLAMRLASPLTVKDGKGSILSAAGGQNEKGTWGKPDVWWDYFGPAKNASAGILLMSGPGNPEVWSHSRDYGVLVANPFPLDNKENRELRTVIAPGKVFTLRFGVQVHEHARREDFNPEKAYQRYLTSVP